MDAEHSGSSRSTGLHHAFLGVGSNLDPEKSILSGLLLLREILPIIEISRFYHTLPVGPPLQPLFINGAIHVGSPYDPHALKFSLLRGIERKMGRKRTADKYASRSIDLDILLFNNCIIEEEGLVIPNPGIVKYPFMAIPLAELVPDVKLPGKRKSLQEIASKMDTFGMVYLEDFTRNLHTQLGLSLQK